MSTTEFIEPDTRAAPRTISSSGRGLLSAARPRQWVKNGLVVAAPFAAGALLKGSVIGGCLLALVAFICASAAVYLANDVVDVERDRRHPRKRYRPIASGAVSPRAATVAAVALGAAAVTVPVLAGNVELGVVVGSYLVLSASYSLFLKHVPGVELAIVASGFVLRALAGAVGAHVPPSNWFLAVTAFAALTITFGKRYAERLNTGLDDAHTRPALASYPTRLLSGGRDVALLAAAACYGGWVLTRGADDRAGFAAVSAAPLAWAVLRYRRINEGGGGEAPEELLLRDRSLQASLGLWALGMLAVIVLV